MPTDEGTILNPPKNPKRQPAPSKTSPAKKDKPKK